MSVSKRFVYFLMGLLFCALSAHSQDECELVLNRASDEFNAGHFYGIPAMLHDCLEKNHKVGWRQRANILLAETYLLLDDPLGAERSYLEILRANPEFVPDKGRDPIDLVYLGSKFTATPIFSLYGRIGSNVSFMHAIMTRTAFPGDTHDQYHLKPGINIGAGLDFNYDENLSLGIEANYVFTAYQFQRTSVFGLDRESLYDKQSWVRFPLLLKFTDAKGKYRPFGYIGYAFDILLADKATLTYNDRTFTDGRIIPDERESPVLQFTPKRNKFNRAIILGGGLKYKLGLNYAFFDVRYSMGMTNIVKVNRTIEDQAEDPAFTWGHIDNLVRMNNLSISVGYIYPLYKPRKLKKARSRSVLQRIKNESNEVTLD
jgi:hypothetical protein